MISRASFRVPSDAALDYWLKRFAEKELLMKVLAINSVPRLLTSMIKMINSISLYPMKTIMGLPVGRHGNTMTYLRNSRLLALDQ